MVSYFARVVGLLLFWTPIPSMNSVVWASSEFGLHPYELKTERELFILGGAVGIGAPALILQNNISVLSPYEISQLNPDQVNALDRSATSNYSPAASSASDYLLAGMVIAPSALLFSQDVQSQYLIVGTMYLETTLLAAVVPALTKVTTQRIRPFVYNPNAPLNEKMTQDAKESFFSGHASVSFSSAVFLSSVYSNYFPESQWKGFVWSGSLAVASSIAYLRYASGKHFPTDLITGAAAGALIGYAIPVLHRTHEDEAQTQVTFIPQLEREQVGLALRAQF